MTSQPDPTSSAGEIIEFVPRHLLRRDAQRLVDAMRADDPMPDVRRMIADACTRYGASLVGELGRIIARGPHPAALSAIAILLIIADEPAQEILWQVARDEGRHPMQRLEALRGLYQQGQDVPLAQLVALSTLAERSTAPLRDREVP